MSADGRRQRRRRPAPPPRPRDRRERQQPDHVLRREDLAERDERQHAGQRGERAGRRRPGRRAAAATARSSDARARAARRRLGGLGDRPVDAVGLEAVRASTGSPVTRGRRARRPRWPAVDSICTGPVEVEASPCRRRSRRATANGAEADQHDGRERRDAAHRGAPLAPPEQPADARSATSSGGQSLVIRPRRAAPCPTTGRVADEQDAARRRPARPGPGRSASGSARRPAAARATNSPRRATAAERPAQAWRDERARAASPREHVAYAPPTSRQADRHQRERRVLEAEVPVGHAARCRAGRCRPRRRTGRCTASSLNGPSARGHQPDATSARTQSASRVAATR